MVCLVHQSRCCDGSFDCVFLKTYTLKALQAWETDVISLKICRGATGLRLLSLEIEAFNEGQ